MQYNQDNFNRVGKVVLSPRRLDPNVFSQFTKSSYIPEPNKERPLRQQSADKTMNSYQQYNGIERQNDVRVAESSNFAPTRTQKTLQENVSYDPLEPLRKNRNIHDQHLSVEEEEWETKHLNPKRLDEAKKLNFINQQKTDIRSKYPPQHDIHLEEHRTRVTESFGSKNSLSEERQAGKNDREKINSTFTGTPNNNSSNSEERNNNRQKDYSSDSRLSTSELLNEIHVERSPALRKLIKQDEISEGPIQRVTTRASVQSDPWDEMETRTTHEDSRAGNKQDNETDKYVGKLDLKQWSSEIERNKLMYNKSTEPIHPRKEDKERSQASSNQNSLKTTQNVYKDEVIIINRNQSPKKAGDVFVLESENDSNSQEKMLRPRSLKYKEKLNFSDENGVSPNRSTPTTPTRIQHTVVIEDNQATTNENDDYLNRKRVGKVSLGPWEEHTFPKYTAKNKSSDENRNQSFNSRDSRSSFTTHDGRPSQLDNSPQYTNSTSNGKTDIGAQERMHANITHENNEYINHRSFNKSMSEDELAWEKRFSKPYERKISVEEEPEVEIIQRKVSDQRIPRLSDGNDENENYFNFGKISLDDDEVRRVRENKTNIGNKTNYRNEDSYITKKSSNDQFNINGQNSSKPSHTTKFAGHSSQLTEEELAWEEKKSKPGRLDFSKFSQFSR